MIQWPEFPICHDDDDAAKRWLSGKERWSWKPKVISGRRIHVCEYCGSIHPKDLFTALFDDHAELLGADWKHGWPHKFYLHGWFSPEKWYNVHFVDLVPESFDILSAVVSEASGIEWFKTETNIAYAAPRFNFQRIPNELDFLEMFGEDDGIQE